MSDGGPAFPSGKIDAGSCWEDFPYLGMSLRDYFAAHAPQPSEQMLGGWATEEQRDAILRAACENAYRWADAMLKAREQA